MKKCCLMLITIIGFMGGAASGQPVPIGLELKVNTDTDYATGVAVSSDPAGNFVVVWNSSPLVDYCFCFPTVFGQRFDKHGAALGANFKVSSVDNQSQAYPSIVHDLLGNFIVVWQDTDGDASGIVGRRFDRKGKALGPNFLVTASTAGNQTHPDVAVDGAGESVVVWEDRAGLDGDGFGVFGQRYGVRGRPVGAQFQVNNYTTSTQYAPKSLASSLVTSQWSGPVPGRLDRRSPTESTCLANAFKGTDRAWETSS